VTRRASVIATPRPRFSASLRLRVSASVLLLLAACQPERKVVSYHPFFEGVPGAQLGTAPVGPRFENRVDPTAAPPEGIVIEKPDKSKVLISRSIRHLMTHLENTLSSGEDDLLFDQLIADAAKEEFRAQGKDPREIVTYLKKNHEDIRALFGRMPFAEQSPSVILLQPGNKVMHLKLTGLAAEDVRFTHLWVRLEKENWKLLWID
jgi:hypothetical protein